MTSSFQVVSDELRAHASHLDALGDRLNTAVSAASQVSMDTEAYGIICSFVPPIVNVTTQQHATDALNAAVEGMSGTADNLRSAATSYDDQEGSNASPFEAQLRNDGTPMSPAAGNSGFNPRIGTTVTQPSLAPAAKTTDPTGSVTDAVMDPVSAAVDSSRAATPAAGAVGDAVLDPVSSAVDSSRDATRSVTNAVLDPVSKAVTDSTGPTLAPAGMESPVQPRIGTTVTEPTLAPAGMETSPTEPSLARGRTETDPVERS